MPRLAHVVIQPTPFCNIDCRYCYLPDRTSKATLSLETARAAFTEIFASGWCAGRLHVIWHAGEPLVLPPSYYEAMVELIADLAPPGLEVRHALNTNATLLDDAWCEFLLRRRFGVGVSLDGPKEIHDAYRVTRAGRGTFEATIAGLRRLRDAGAPFYVISVITERSLDAADELFAFYKAEGIERVCLNFEEAEGVHLESSLAGEARIAAVDRFLRRFWNLMMADGNRLWVREFGDIFANVLRPASVHAPNALTEPLGHLNVDWQGNFTTYSPELLGMASARHGDFRLGTFGRTTLAEALATPKFAAIKAEVDAGVELCRRTCDYFSLCRGGAPSNKLAENGGFDTAETLACRLRIKLTADIVLEAIENSVGGPAAFGELAQPGEATFVV